MTNKNKIILGLAAVALFFVLIVFFQDQLKSGKSLFNDNNQPVSGTNNVDTAKPTTENSALDAATALTAKDPSVDLKISKPLAAQLDVMPSADSAPKQNLVDLADVAPTTIKLTVSATGFNPSEITLNSGQAVSLALTSVDANPHVLVFPGTPLRALTMTVLGGETKVIEFVAPEAGVYNFRDNIPSYRENVGRLIVK